MIYFEDTLMWDIYKSKCLQKHPNLAYCSYTISALQTWNSRSTPRPLPSNWPVLLKQTMQSHKKKKHTQIIQNV